MHPPADLVAAADRLVRGTVRRAFADRPYPPPWRDRGDLAARVAASRGRLEELLDGLIDFWFPASIEPAGGFRVDAGPDGATFRPARRHRTIPTARLTWFLAALADSPGGRDEHAQAALHGVAALRDLLWDDRHGGFFYEVDRTGRPLADHKDVYSHAFALNALARVVIATGDRGAGELADATAEVLERHTRDHVHGGYREVAARDWGRLDDPPATRHLADPELRSLNCHLHLTDAFETHTRARPSGARRQRLAQTAEILAVETLDDRARLGAAWFEPDWTALPDRVWWRTTVSYGHEAERATVLDRAADTLGLDRGPVDRRLAAIVHAQLHDGLDRWHGGVFTNGSLGGAAWDTTKLWWAQAESLHAYLLVHRLTGSAAAGHAYLATLDWITGHQVAPNGGWYERVGRLGRVDRTQIGPWQTPYHVGRALLACHALSGEVACADGAAPRPASS